MPQSIVSVIVPTKNSARTLAACLRSIKRQTYPKVELIVVDNSSTDATPKIARRYANKVYTKGPERSAQRNFGVSKATGKYVFIIDSDMKLAPTVVAECVALLQADATMAGVVVPEESFGEGFWAQCKKLERSFYVGVPFMEAARFFRKAEYVQVGGFDENLNGNEDWDLSQRMERLGTLGHTRSYIFHDEGRISLSRSIKKKFYYVQRFPEYQQKDPDNPRVKQQTSVIARYWLYLSHPIRLFRNPILGIGMLFMKTCEFGFGAAGYFRVKLRRA